jgi:hypothetical protein
MRSSPPTFSHSWINKARGIAINAFASLARLRLEGEAGGEGLYLRIV